MSIAGYPQSVRNGEHERDHLVLCVGKIVGHFRFLIHACLQWYNFINHIWEVNQMHIRLCAQLIKRVKINVVFVRCVCKLLLFRIIKIDNPTVWVSVYCINLTPLNPHCIYHVKKTYPYRLTIPACFMINALCWNILNSYTHRKLMQILQIITEEMYDKLKEMISLDFIHLFLYTCLMFWNIPAIIWRIYAIQM